MEETPDPTGTEHVAAEEDIEALYMRGASLRKRGDLESAQVCFHQAALGGHTDAQLALGRLLRNQNDLAGAEMWFRRGAEAGNAHAMNALGAMLKSMGDFAESATWFRRAVDAGLAAAMFNLGLLFAEKGDITEEEFWFRRAAEGGSSLAAYHLGFTCIKKGDPEGAEPWWRQAAKSGNPDAMYNLGVLLKKRGDLEAAETWFRRAGDAGDANAMVQLAHLLQNKGNLISAERWFRSAADGGELSAMNGLAQLLHDKGDFDAATSWYDRAIERGSLQAMVGLGALRQDRGDLAGAESLFHRAAEAGHDEGTTSLLSLQSKIESDRDLNSITFDTFGWTLSRNRTDIREWRSEGTSLTELYVRQPPPFRCWDADEIHQDARAALALTESPDFSFEDLQRSPDWEGALSSVIYPEQMDVLDVECLGLHRAKCVLLTIRQRVHDKVLYSAGIFILFKQCFWILRIDVYEEGSLGEREGAVAHRILDGWTAQSPTAPFDPYDPQWDGIVAVENDPLVRVRLLALRLKESIDVSGIGSQMEVFAPGD
jgi:TPR repeat protein